MQERSIALANTLNKAISNSTHFFGAKKGDASTLPGCDESGVREVLPSKVEQKQQG